MRLAASLTALLTLWLGHTLISSTGGPRGSDAGGGARPGLMGGPVTAAGRWHPSSRPAAPRVSRSRSPEPAPLATAREWARSAKARAVAACESGGNPRSVSRTGKYRGKWQMDADFWRTYGGLRYAPRPELASEAAQDTVAYRGWLARGWQPWTCAR